MVVSLLSTFTKKENVSQDMKRRGHTHITSKWQSQAESQATQAGLSLVGGLGVEGTLSTPGDDEPN